MSYNADDKEQVEEAKRRAKVTISIERNVVIHLMSTSSGRKWMHNKLTSCHIFSNPLVPGQSDVTFFNLGEQNVGKMLLADIQAYAPAEYLKMLEEAKSES